MRRILLPLQSRNGHWFFFFNSKRHMLPYRIGPPPATQCVSRAQKDFANSARIDTYRTTIRIRARRTIVHAVLVVALVAQVALQLDAPLILDVCRRRVLEDAQPRLAVAVADAEVDGCPVADRAACWGRSLVFVRCRWGKGHVMIENLPALPHWQAVSALVPMGLR